MVCACVKLAVATGNIGTARISASAARMVRNLISISFAYLPHLNAGRSFREASDMRMSPSHWSPHCDGSNSSHARAGEADADLARALRHRDEHDVMQTSRLMAATAV
jgi:hypothetical protein